jgi:AcrR family transcriptional regulator
MAANQPEIQSPGDSLTKGERTRLQIMQAANQLFSNQGYHGTSMRQIADAAGIALGGIYNHFTSKEEIFTSAVRYFHSIHTILPALEADQGDTVEEIIYQSSNQMYTTLDQREDFISLLLIEAVEFKGKHLPGLFSEIFSRAVQFSQRLKEKPGALREDIPLPVMVATFIGMIFSFFLFQRLFGKLVNLAKSDQILEQVIDIYLHGIQKGGRS